MKIEAHSYARTETGIGYYAPGTGEDPDLIVNIPQDGQIGLLVVDGMLIKHGSADKVSETMDAYVQKWPADLMADGGPEMITLSVRDLTDEIIEEINACIAITGRAGKLSARLAEMSGGSTAEPN